MPMLRLPNHPLHRSGPVANIIIGIGKLTGIGAQLTLDDKINSFGAFNLIHCKLKISLTNSGILGNTDLQEAQTYYLQTAIVW